jgi:myo-inositol 2-dehydrogenase / D-chiro-inositol 1-dehydrogenase
VAGGRSRPRPLGVALLGAGRLGATHARTLAGLPEAALVVVADPEPGARSVADACGARFVDDPQAAIADPGVEAVVIATPTGTHAALIEAAARAGKAIFCEKPIALDVGATERALAAAGKAGVPLQIGFQRRYDPGFAEARRAIAAGELGRLHLLRAVSHDPYPPPPHFIAASGGQFVDMTIHDLDVARFLTGTEVEAVSAVGARLGPRAAEFTAANDWDTTVLTLRFAGGALGSIVNSRQSGYGYDIHAEVLGERGALRIGYERHTPVTRYDRTGVHHDYVPYFPERFGQAYALELRAFVAGVRAGTPLTPAGADGLAAIRLALAATESARRDGVWVGLGP